MEKRRRSIALIDTDQRLDAWLKVLKHDDRYHGITVTTLPRGRVVITLDNDGNNVIVNSVNRLLMLEYTTPMSRGTLSKLLRTVGILGVQMTLPTLRIVQRIEDDSIVAP